MVINFNKRKLGLVYLYDHAEFFGALIKVLTIKMAEIELINVKI